MRKLFDYQPPQYRPYRMTSVLGEFSKTQNSIRLIRPCCAPVEDAIGQVRGEGCVTYVVKIEAQGRTIILSVCLDGGSLSKEGPRLSTPLFARALPFHPLCCTTWTLFGHVYSGQGKSSLPPPPPSAPPFVLLGGGAIGLPTRISLFPACWESGLSEFLGMLCYVTCSPGLPSSAA